MQKERKTAKPLTSIVKKQYFLFLLFLDKFKRLPWTKISNVLLIHHSIHFCVLRISILFDFFKKLIDYLSWRLYFVILPTKSFLERPHQAVGPCLKKEYNRFLVNLNLGPIKKYSKISFSFLRLLSLFAIRIKIQNSMNLRQVFELFWCVSTFGQNDEIFPFPFIKWVLKYQLVSKQS